MFNRKEDEVRAIVDAAIEQYINEEYQKQEVWPPYMSPATTAIFMDKSKSCIRKWITEGVIPVVRLPFLCGRDKEPVFVDRRALEKLFVPKREGASS